VLINEIYLFFIDKNNFYEKLINFGIDTFAINKTSAKKRNGKTSCNP
jgi:hypothetical protein